MSAKVQCPICARSVPEANINLHLDLQCPGTGGPSSSPNVHATPTPAIKAATRSKLDAVQTPTIFGTQRRPSSSAVKVEREDKEEGGEKRRRSASPEAGGKRARVDPLIANQPLAEKQRPSALSAYVGQDAIVGPGSLLRRRIEAGEGVGSIILWGPPGCGKTTLARLIAKTANAHFKELSATSAGTTDVRQVFEQAKNALKLTGRKTILMVDEIHRFTRPQQDLFLPYVENGWVQLIGATTENPSFKVNGALLSRCQVITLFPLSPASLTEILTRALDALDLPSTVRIPRQLISFLADVSDGDARQALGALELAVEVCRSRAAAVAALADDVDGVDGSQAGLGNVSADRAGRLDGESGEVKSDVVHDHGPGSGPSPGGLKHGTDGNGCHAITDAADTTEADDAALMLAIRQGLRKGYNRSGEERYDLISALHKSIRGSDGSAAMYWLARMLESGEDPLYVARRLVVVASEDVGLADPSGLPLAVAAYQACQVIGMPECRINLAHAVAHLALAPKSTRSYTAYKRAAALARAAPLPPVPLQIRNAPTRLMQQMGYGDAYAYNPDYRHPVHNTYVPQELAAHSSHSADPDAHLLKTDEAERRGKEWDETRLRRWEDEVNGGAPWMGRAIADDDAG
ncbi:DNA-dependent ATPase mgs1 [Cryptotrichosporon argae]